MQDAELQETRGTERKAEHLYALPSTSSDSLCTGASQGCSMQVIYVRIEDIIKARMADHVPLPTRLAMHSANCELNKLLCIMASARAGYHIEELTQVGYDAVGFAGAQLDSRRA
jgi:hypothetical protein